VFILKGKMNSELRDVITYQVLSCFHQTCLLTWKKIITLVLWPSNNLTIRRRCPHRNRAIRHKRFTRWVEWVQSCHPKRWWIKPCKQSVFHGQITHKSHSTETNGHDAVCLVRCVGARKNSAGVKCAMRIMIHPIQKPTALLLSVFYYRA